MWFRNGQSPSSTPTSSSSNTTLSLTSIIKSPPASGCGSGDIEECPNNNPAIHAHNIHKNYSTSAISLHNLSNTPVTPPSSHISNSPPGNTPIYRISNIFRQRSLVGYTLVGILISSFIYCILLYNSAVHETSLQTLASRHYHIAEDVHKRSAGVHAPDRLIEAGKYFLLSFQTFVNKNFKQYFQHNLRIVPENDEQNNHTNIVVNHDNQTQLYRDAISNIFTSRFTNQYYYLELLGFHKTIFCDFKLHLYIYNISKLFNKIPVCIINLKSVLIVKYRHLF